MVVMGTVMWRFGSVKLPARSIISYMCLLGTTKTFDRLHFGRLFNNEKFVSYLIVLHVKMAYI